VRERLFVCARETKSRACAPPGGAHPTVNLEENRLNHLVDYFYMQTLSQAIQLAAEYHQAGHLSQAAVLYRQILQVNPRNSDILHLLGVLAGQQGHYAEAVKLIKKAIAIAPKQPTFHYNLGNALMGLGKLAPASQSFQRTLALQPNHANAYNNLGTVLEKLGKWAEAIACYQKILQFDPNYEDAYYNLGVVFTKQGKLDEAKHCYQQVLALNPHHATASNNLGNILRMQQQAEEALFYYQRALAGAPNYPELYANLGSTFQELHRWEEAITCYQQLLHLNPQGSDNYKKLGSICYHQGQLRQAAECYQQALSFNPTDADAHNQLGTIFYHLNQFEAAIESYQRALSIAPQDAKLHNNLGVVFKSQGKLKQATTCFHQAVSLAESAHYYNNLGLTCKQQGLIPQALAYFQRALESQPVAWIHSNWLLTMQYVTEATASSIFAEHQKFNEYYAKPLAAGGLSRRPHQRLKIGYVSADFYSHAVAHVLELPLANHDHQQFEIVCYYNHVKTETVTARFQHYADHWRNCAALSDEALAEQIRQDQIDILVDLSGHLAGNRLLVFARKPAPVQITYLGYPNTTGLETIDYRISDPYVDPPGITEAFNSETLIRMPTSYFCYRPPDASPPVNKLPASHQNYVTLGSLNGHYKLNVKLFELWALLLKMLPTAKLFIKNNSLNDEAVGQTLREQFAQWAIDPDRLQLAGHTPYPLHLTAYHAIDIALDSFPFTGGITTFEALWMGVPVITLVGERPVSRQGFSILTTLGLTELITHTPAEYVDQVVKLASDIKYLQHLRATLRDRLQSSPLMDAPIFTRHLEALYRQVWEMSDGNDRIS